MGSSGSYDLLEIEIHVYGLLQKTGSFERFIVMSVKVKLESIGNRFGRQESKTDDDEWKAQEKAYVRVAYLRDIQSKGECDWHKLLGYFSEIGKLVTGAGGNICCTPRITTLRMIGKFGVRRNFLSVSIGRPFGRGCHCWHVRVNIFCQKLNVPNGIIKHKSCSNRYVFRIFMPCFRFSYMFYWQGIWAVIAGRCGDSELSYCECD